MKRIPWLFLFICALLLWSNLRLRSAPRSPDELHRSPIDLAVLPGGKLAVSANHTADSASLLDLASGNILAEQPCGRKPTGIACSRDGRFVAVTNLWSGSVTLLSVRDSALTALKEIAVGAMPRGVVFAPDGKTLYVALSGVNEVVQVELQSHKVLRRWPAPTEPRRLALSRDGRVLAAACTRAAHVCCWDTVTGKEIWDQPIHDAFNLLGLTFSPDDKELVTTQIHHRYHAMARHNIEQGWAIDNRLAKLTIVPDARARYWQIALDLRGKAVGDPTAVAFSAAGDCLAVAAAGTHELLFFQPTAIPWNTGEPGDFLDVSLELGKDKFRRVPLGGRPMAVQFTDAGTQAVVANYLLDSLQIVDVKAGTIVRTIHLGGPATSDLARKGEAIFYDAGRSHHQWFSCHTCHTDGHTCGRTFDTLNDDSYGNAKLTPTLRGVSKTPPYTWHGWQDKLDDAISKSLTDTLFGPKPSDEDVKAVAAFLATLDHPPNPNRRPNGSLSEAAERGKAIFNGKARCVRCHQGEHYTSTKNYDVKLEADGSPFDYWNPPSLRGVWDRGPFLHEGRVDTLEEVLRVQHAPEKLGGQALTPEERKELIEFLKSL